MIVHKQPDMSHILPHCIDMMSHKQYYKQLDRSDMHFHNKSHMTHHLRYYIDMLFHKKSDTFAYYIDMLFDKYSGRYYNIDNPLCYIDM